MNILSISADDLFDVVRHRHAFGVEISTPNLDRLMEQSMHFTNAYCSTALCNPSRTSIMTSKNPFTTGVHKNNQQWGEFVDPTDTLPAIMRKAGYLTAAFGKVFHDPGSNDRSRSFDVTSEEFTSHDPETAGSAIAFIRSAESEFFAMVGLNNPHEPHDPPKRYFDLYPLDQIRLDEWHGDLPSAFIRSLLRDVPMSAPEARQFVQGYLAEISELDTQLGRLMRAIEGTDTALVFFSDHGYSLGDHDDFHKFNLWEQAAAVPLAVYHPDLPARKVAANVSLLDVAPTILDLAGVPIPADFEGVSLLEPVAEDRPVFTTMWGSISVKQGEWRFTHYMDGTRELFNCSTDPDNSRNLVDLRPNVEARLQGVLSEFMSDNHIAFDEARLVTRVGRSEDATVYFMVDLEDISDRGGIDTIYCDDAEVRLPAWCENFGSMSDTRIEFIGNARDNIVHLQRGNHRIDTGGDDDVRGGGDDIIRLGPGDDLASGRRGHDSSWAAGAMTG